MDVGEEGGKAKVFNQVLCHKIIFTPIVKNKHDQLMFDLTIMGKQKRNRGVCCIRSYEDETGVHFDRILERNRWKWGSGIWLLDLSKKSRVRE